MEIRRLTNLETEKIDHKLWRVTKPLVFQKGTLDWTTTVVPAGFITDGASAPWMAYSLCPPMGGAHAEAAVLHDWYYSLDSGDIGRKTADSIFYHAMISNGTSVARAKAIYLSVRMGGSASFKKCHSIDKIEG